MKFISGLIFLLIAINFQCLSQINIHSITYQRQPNAGGYTLDGYDMNTSSRVKLLSTNNFGPGGVYSKPVNIVDGFLTSNSLTQVSNFPYTDLFFFGTFDKSDNTLVQFTNEEIDSLYNWSTRGGKLIICGSPPFGSYDPSVLNSKWGFQITQIYPSSFISNAIGENTDIFNGPFGSIDSAIQGGSGQGHFSLLPNNVSVLATDVNNNPTIIMDCTTLDLIVADVDGYTNPPGALSVGSSITNDQDKYWANTIVFLDKLQGLPTISVNGTNFSVANVYNSYQWYKDDVVINGSTSNSIAVNEDGQYYVRVTVNGGCAVKSNTITADSTLGIKENISINTIEAFPNPSKEKFNIELPDQQNFNLSIFDITGRKVHERKNARGTVKVDCSSFSSGMYFVQAVNEKNSLSCKFIKQ